MDTIFISHVTAFTGVANTYCARTVIRLPYCLAVRIVKASTAKALCVLISNIYLSACFVFQNQCLNSVNYG